MKEKTTTPTELMAEIKDTKKVSSFFDAISNLSEALLVLTEEQKECFERAKFQEEQSKKTKISLGAPIRELV